MRFLEKHLGYTAFFLFFSLVISGAAILVSHPDPEMIKVVILLLSIAIGGLIFVIHDFYVGIKPKAPIMGLVSQKIHYPPSTGSILVGKVAIPRIYPDRYFITVMRPDGDEDSFSVSEATYLKTEVGDPYQF
jgi:hypothetical protein